jgi:hypothetical protein
VCSKNILPTSNFVLDEIVDYFLENLKNISTLVGQSNQTTNSTNLYNNLDDNINKIEMSTSMSSSGKFSSGKLTQKERIVNKFDNMIKLLLNEFKTSTIIDNEENMMKKFIKFIEIKQKKENIVISTINLVETNIPLTSKPLVILYKKNTRI